MKSSDAATDISRRVLLATLATVPALPNLFVPTAARAHVPAIPLSSWNDGPAKQVIVDFVRATTDRASAKFVLPKERIAT